MDIVKNDWPAGRQERVAQVSIDRGKPKLTAADPARWQPVLDGIGEGIDPREKPDRYLAEYRKRLHGDHLFATKPHDDRTCPFTKSDSLPLDPVDVPDGARGQQAQPA